MIPEMKYSRINKRASRVAKHEVRETVSKKIGPDGMEITIEQGEHGKGNYVGRNFTDPHIQMGGKPLGHNPFGVLKHR